MSVLLLTEGGMKILPFLLIALTGKLMLRISANNFKVMWQSAPNPRNPVILEIILEFFFKTS
jgi:hypothetical protein